MSQSSTRRSLLAALAGVLLAAILVVLGIQIFGGPTGAECSDSYSCSGFLIGGAECVETDDGRYCTLYCDQDLDCPPTWRCLPASPTVLTIRTSSSGNVCIRP